MAGFDKASAVHRTADGYLAELDPEWTVSGRPNGGYLLALMARAAIAADDASTHPHPISASAVYCSPPKIGPATITVEPLRQGRSASQVRARLSQSGVVCVEALFTLARLTDTAPQWIDGPPVSVAPELDCLVVPVEPPGVGVRVEMLNHVTQRLDLSRSNERSDGDGEFRGWLRFIDQSDFDPVRLLFAADSFPPATLTMGSVGWVPTLELTVYIRAVPAPGPLRARQRARVLAGDLVDQVCELWDSRDRMVAQATQLAAVRVPRPDGVPNDLQR